MQGFRFYGKWCYVGTWECKFQAGFMMCGCCSPKDVIPFYLARLAVVKEHNIPREISKSKPPSYGHNRLSGMEMGKSKAPRRR